MIIVFGCDQRFLPHLSVAITSLLHNNSDIHISIYIIHSDIDSKGWDKLISLDSHKMHTFINAKVGGSELNDLLTRGQFTKAIYYRLLIETIVPNDKALYIDADVVINGSLKTLWSLDITNTYLAAVEEPVYSNHQLEMLPDARYFNSGVMLINLKKWRNDFISKQVLECIRTKTHTLVWLDQCALNAVINGRWKRVSPRFNLQTYIFEMDAQLREQRYDFGDIEDSINNPVVIHYTGYSKPWHTLNEHPYKNLYWHYLKKTPYKTIFPTDITLKRLVLRCLPKNLRSRIKNYLLPKI